MNCCGLGSAPGSRDVINTLLQHAESDFSNLLPLNGNNLGLCDESLAEGGDTFTTDCLTAYPQSR